MSPDAPQLQLKAVRFLLPAPAISRSPEMQLRVRLQRASSSVPTLTKYSHTNPINPDHCVPEYSADIKGAGDKVDYALLH